MGLGRLHLHQRRGRADEHGDAQQREGDAALAGRARGLADEEQAADRQQHQAGEAEAVRRALGQRERLAEGSEDESVEEEAGGRNLILHSGRDWVDALFG